MDTTTPNCSPDPKVGKVPQPQIEPQIEPQVQIKKEPAKLLASNSSVDLTGMMDNCIAISPRKKRAKLFDAEEIIMGGELSDNEIHLAQQLLKKQFPTLNGL